MTPQTTGTPASGGSGAPALTPAEKTQYTRIFVGVPPEGGLVSGECDTIFCNQKIIANFFCLDTVHQDLKLKQSS
jgi:hypothetical protein